MEAFVDSSRGPARHGFWQSLPKVAITSTVAVACIVAVSLVAISVGPSHGEALGEAGGAVRFQMLQRVGESEWGYGASNGPQTWGTAFPSCKGSKQSPIQIIDEGKEGFVIKRGVRASCTDNNRSPPVTRTISDEATAFKKCSDVDGPRCRPGETCNSGMPAETLKSNVAKQEAQRLVINWPNAAGLYTEYNIASQAITVPTATANWRTTFEGSTYSMKQFLFKQPSEHVVNGHRFQLEMQIEHTSDWDGSTLIVSVLFDDGAHNAFLDKLGFEARTGIQIPGGVSPLGALEPSVLLDQPQVVETSEAVKLRLLRKEKCDKAKADPTEAKGILGGSLDGVDTRADLLCIDRATEASSKYNYWTYSGSLSAPPCTEGVKWVVLSDYATASPAQFAAYPFEGASRPLARTSEVQVFEKSPTAWTWGYRSGINGPGILKDPKCTDEAGSLNVCKYTEANLWALHGYETCALGKQQSPINVDSRNALPFKHVDLQLKYSAQVGLSFTNNGRALVVAMPITDIYIKKRLGVQAVFEGMQYYLEDFQFNSPAGHSIDGQDFPLEIQLTHRGEGDLSVARYFRLLMLFRLGPTCNSQLAKLNWVKLPKNPGERRAIPDGFRLLDLFPADQTYYSYDGSLSRPPCTEGVAQAIIRQPLEICARQLEEYRLAVPNPNARPQQPLHGREVQLNSFKPDDGITDSFWSWGYSFENDATKWARFYPKCRGKEQSPIVILTSDIFDLGSAEQNVRLSYEWAPRCRVAVQNTGRVLSVQLYAGYTKWEGVEWRVIKVEFHAGSEHQVNDKQFPMEMQIMHTDSEGNFMILSLLYEIGQTQNRFLDSLGWDNLPGPPLFSTDRRAGTGTEEDAIKALSANVYDAQVREVPAETESVLSIHIRKDPVDLLSAMPPDRSYLTYKGSLTKPPCTEGVTWVILEQRARMNMEQLRKFRYGSMSTHFANFRKPMPIGLREVRRNADAVDESEELPWDYDKKGPSTWPYIGYATCSGDESSISQSPIDIITKDTQANSNYELSMKFSVIPASGVTVSNDGHAIVVKGLVGSIVFEKMEYVLKQLHIRRGEHRLDGRVFPVELQFELEDSAKQMLILAVMLELGTRNEWLDALQVSRWSSLTRDGKKEATSRPFSAAWLLPSQGASKPVYFSYDGSLTYPPCHQRVTWVVLSEVGSLASSQLDSMFPKSFGAQNFRPVQPLNGRIVSRLSKVAALSAAGKSSTLASVASSRRAQGDDVDRDWGYSFAKGPLKWGRLYAGCRGDKQSPVNIVPCAVVDNTANRLVLQWQSQANGLVTNNGAAIQVQYTAGTTLFDGEAYSPEYLEFHHPSEHFVSSKQFDLELQIHHVHRSDPSKRLAVVVLFVLSLYDNPFLEELQFTDLPGRAGDSNRLPAPFNPGHGMPMNPDYFDYDGSLTAPPCTEGVKFVVMNERPGVSSEQMLNNRTISFLSPSEKYQYRTEYSRASRAALAKLFTSDQAGLANVTHVLPRCSDLRTFIPTPHDPHSYGCQVRGLALMFCACLALGLGHHQNP